MPKPHDLDAILATADNARDQGEWTRAGLLYRQYVDARPDAAPIWVQLGHALKETGDLSGAELAYRHSLALDRGVADTHVQIGHIFKMTGRTDDAITSYSQAVEIDPRLESGWRELRLFGIERVVEYSSGERLPVRVIDLSDVFFYLKHHSTVSGIQRVQIGIANSLIELSNVTSEYIFVTDTADHSGYIEVSYDLIGRLVRTLSQSTVSLTDLRRIGAQAESDGSRYTPAPGDVVLILGAFWVLPNIIEQLISFKRSGVRIGVMIHDVIPITHPEYCERDLTDTFHMYVQSVLSIVDLIISISENTHCEVLRLMNNRSMPIPDMVILKNAHATWRRRPIATASASIEIADIIESPYVLYVSTIEIRKNHTTLFKAWKKLIENHGIESVPTLVFVGRPGWRVRDLMDQIIGTQYLGGRIRILHDISDVDLQTLYEGCMFTTFPSFEEGWGLPVGESLIFGKPCAASSASSIPEVGGDFVDYFDPNNLNEAYLVLEKLVYDPAYLASRSNNISANFIPRTWRDVAKTLADNISELFPLSSIKAEDQPNSHIDRVPVPFVPGGKMNHIGHRDSRSAYINAGFGTLVHFVFDMGWYPVENFGRWLAHQRGGMEFRVGDKDTDEDVVLFLELCTVEWFSGNDISIVVNGSRMSVTGINGGEVRFVRFKARSVGGKISMRISVLGNLARPSNLEDPRIDLSIGIKSFGYALASDPLARIALIEDVFANKNGVLSVEPTNAY